MKKVTLLGSLLVAGTLTFTGISGTAQADEEEGAMCNIIAMISFLW